MRDVWAFLACLMPWWAVAGPSSEEFFRPYEAGYVAALAACMQHLEGDGAEAVFAGWEVVEPPKPVCQTDLTCQSLSKPVAAWTVVHSGVLETRAFCFGAWTSKLILRSGSVITALNSFAARAVATKRLVPIPPQPTWIEGPTLSIREVYEVNSPPHREP